MDPQPPLAQQVADLTQNMNLVLQCINDQRNQGSTTLVEEQQHHHQYHDQNGHERERSQDGSRVRSHANHANYEKVNLRQALNFRDMRERLNEKRQSKIQARGGEGVKSSAYLVGLEAELRKRKKRIDDIEKNSGWTIHGGDRTSIH